MKILKNIPLAKYTTFRIGGNADIFCEIEKKEDFVDTKFLEILNNIQKEKKNIFILGGGSNTVFSDKGFRGLVIYMKNRDISIVGREEGDEGDERREKKIYIRCEAGAQIMPIFLFAKAHEADFSPFATIPGTIGGALAGNAGVPKMEMADIFFEAEVFDMHTQRIMTVQKDFFTFSYRFSGLDTSRYIIWSVTIALQKRKCEEIEQEAQCYLDMRKQKQPYGKTAGSFFKNPKEGAAGMFLEKSGFKGKKHNGVFFSEKHANFLMSDGSATQNDVLELQHSAQKKVFEDYAVRLEREVRCIDEQGKIIE